MAGMAGEDLTVRLEGEKRVSTRSERREYASYHVAETCAG